jgi:O-antigen/teichoic acid export membrane protein
MFSVIVAVCCSGIPLVVSKQTAQYHANINPLAQLNENKTVTASLIICLVFSFIIYSTLLIFSNSLKPLFASEMSMNVLLLLMPALCFFCISSIIRSALWGRKMYAITSILDILEQLLRIGLCIGAIYLFSADNLLITAWTLSLSAAIATLFCIIYYYKKGGRLANPTGHFKPLLATGVPITATKISNNIVTMCISFAIPFLFTAKGLSTEESLAMLGATIGMALPLLCVPNTIVGSLAYIMIPTLSQLSEKKSKAMSIQINSAIKLSIVVACMFVAAFYIIGPEAGEFVFDNKISGPFLQYGAWLIIPIALESIISSMMNAIGLEVKGFINYCIGSAFLFIVCFSFFYQFSLQVFSMALGLSLTICTILDIISIKKATKLELEFIFTLFICIALIFPTIAFTQNVYNLLGLLKNTSMMQFVRLAVTGISSVAFYIGLVCVFELMGITSAFGFSKKRVARKVKIM